MSPPASRKTSPSAPRKGTRRSAPTAPRLRFSAGAAYRHLRRADPVVGALIERHGPYTPRPSPDPYAALVRAILYQQLAGKAAATIMRRWIASYGDDEQVPPPQAVLATSEAQFRAAGVSRQKAASLQDLARHADSGAVDFAALASLPDAEVLDRLTAVRGIGEWTAHMFLIFHLGRPDVLPVGDLGVRNGMARAYRLAQPPTPGEAEAIGAPWAPYRSVGAWYMWRAAESLPPAPALPSAGARPRR